MDKRKQCLEIEIKSIDMAIELGRLIRLQRTSIGLSPERLAELASVHAGDIKAAEAAKCVPILTIIKILAAAGLKISFSELRIKR